MEQRTYYDLCEEVSSQRLYEGLLKYGLFSEKLPPFLSSESFYDYCENRKPNLCFSGKERLYACFNAMRDSNVPRNIGIPNPFAYQLLCESLKNNWESIKKHFKENTENDKEKISRIHIRKLDNKKVLFEMNYKNIEKDGSPEPDFFLGSKYLVKADISNCFPSIYSHSIPWALVGRNVAKQNRRPTDWYNELDKKIRNLKHGETTGLLIGPHASNLIAEIVLTSVDRELSGTWKKYTRHIDDYKCYVSNEEEARKFLLDLNEELRYYNLTLNHKKTEIIKLPSSTDNQWVRLLLAHPIHLKKGMLNYKDIKNYLDTLIDIIKEFDENSAILNYAIKMVYKRILSENAKQYLVKTILHWALIYPYLVFLIEKCVFEQFKIHCDEIQRISQYLYNEGLETQNFECASYAIYFSLKYEFELQRISTTDVLAKEDCIFSLLDYCYCKRYNHKADLYRHKKHVQEFTEEEFEYFWLYAYHVLPESKLKDEWKEIKKNKVSFLKPDFI